MISLIAACMLIFIGSFVQYSIGFGLAVIAAPLLFLLSPIYVPGPVVICALVISSLSAFEHRQEISLKGLQSAVLGRIPGSVAGGWLLLSVSASSLSLWLGLSVLLAVAISLSPWRLAPTPTRMAIAGFLSGFMGTSSSIGGPPMALLLQHQQASYLRANLSAFFVVSCLLSLMVLIPTGFMSLAHLEASLPLIPSALLGVILGRKYGKRLPQQAVRYASLGLCAVSALSAIIAGLLS